MTELTRETPAAHGQQDEARRLPATYAEYLLWPDDATLAEWKDGEIIIYTPPTNRHQEIAGFLLALLSAFARLLDLGIVHIAPFEVKLWPGGPSREPDILFIDRERLGQLTPQRFEGGPDLAIEIVASGSARIDRVEKFIEYERAGVREYWLIDPRPGQEQADFYGLEADGRFASLGLDDDGQFSSLVLPGLRFDPALLRGPLPNPQRLLAGIAKDLPSLREELRAAYRALYQALSQEAH